MTDRQPTPGVHENYAANLMDEPENCPVCDKQLRPDDWCASDIELGICHADCLKGSPVVDLETGTPIDGEAHTFRYQEETSPAPQSHVEVAARAFMELFVAESGDQRALTVDDIDHTELTHRYAALEAALSNGPSLQPNVASLVRKLRGVAELKNPDTHEGFSVSIALDTVTLLKGLCAEAADAIEGTPSPQPKTLVTLADCPIGLFRCGGELCLKTEYGSNEGRIDAYVVSSGEFFWGGTNTPMAQRKVMVEPVTEIAVSPAPVSKEPLRAALLEIAGDRLSDEAWPEAYWRVVGKAQDALRLSPAPQPKAKPQS